MLYSPGVSVWLRGVPARWLIALTLLALVLRVWRLESVPPGLGADEVSIGYNALSILKTGRDEYGAILPLAFRAYGEYKRPVYIYAAVPSIAAFGATPLGVRLPGAIAGTLSIPVLYVVARRLLRGNRVALLAAASLTLSPWHIQFSRGAREASVLVLAEVTLAAALLGAAHTRGRRAGLWLVTAAVALLLAVYSYPGGVLFAPLLVLLLGGSYWRRLITGHRVLAAVALAIVLAGGLPLVGQVLDGRATARPAQTLLLNDAGLRTLAAQRAARDPLLAPLWTPAVMATRLVVDAYIAHFNPTYLFTTGDEEWRHHASDTGQAYLFDLPLVVIGLVTVIRGWRRPAFRVIGGWLLLAPLPAALSEHAPHAVRSIGMVPALALLAAIGAQRAWRWLQMRGLHQDGRLLAAGSVALYLLMYHRYYPVEQVASWSPGMLNGYREAQAAVASGRFDRVVIPQEMGLSYAYALFGTAYDPASYLAQGGTRMEPDSPFYPDPGPLRFAPFEVRVVRWPDEPRNPRVLYVLEGGSQPPAGLRVVTSVKGAGSRDALQLAAFDAGG